jgi:hypothetical protein
VRRSSDTGNANSDTGNAGSETGNADSNTGNAAPEIATRRIEFGAGSFESSFPNYKHSLAGTDTSARRSL